MAYAFNSERSLQAFRDQLRSLGHGEFLERESSWYGDYISGIVWGVNIRIFDGAGGGNEIATYDPKGFWLLDFGRGEQPTEAQQARIRDELLPALGITDWKPDEGND